MHQTASAALQPQVILSFDDGRQMNTVKHKRMFVTGVVATSICGLFAVWVFFCGVVDGSSPDPGGVFVFTVSLIATMGGVALLYAFRPGKDLSEKQKKEQVFLSMHSKLMNTGDWSSLSRRDWRVYHKYRNDFLRRYSAELRSKGIVLPELERDNPSRTSQVEEIPNETATAANTQQRETGGRA